MFVYVESSPPMARGKYDPTSPEECAKRYKIVRLGFDYTAEFLGKIGGVSANAWYNYEDPNPINHRNARRDVLLRIETATGVPTEYFERGIMARATADAIQKIAKGQILLEEAENAPKGRRR